MNIKSKVYLNSFKNIAVVHDDFVAYGGGEKVLKVFSEMFPSADFYTSFVDPKALKSSEFIKNIRSSWIGYFGVIGRLPRLIQLFSPFIWPFFNMDKYDLIITHGSFYLANLVNLIKKRSATTVYYSISPPKNLYFHRHRVWWEALLNGNFYTILRYLDKKALDNTDILITVSKDVQKRFRDIYSRDSLVVYPPVVMPKKVPLKRLRPEYYLYAGRLGREKNVGLLVKAFNINRLPLLIVGNGPYENRLRNKANSNISFLGYKREKDLSEIMLKAKAFVHVAEDDDFPLAPIEAMAHGVPLIVPKSGGTKEAIIAGKTGILINNMTVNSVNKAIFEAERTRFDHRLCHESSKKFSVGYFKKEFFSALNFNSEIHK